MALGHHRPNPCECPENERIGVPKHRFWALLVRIHRVAMSHAFVHFLVHLLGFGIVGSSFGPATPPESSSDHLRFGPETAFYGGDSILFILNLLLNFGVERLNVSKLAIKQY